MRFRPGKSTALLMALALGCLVLLHLDWARMAFYLTATRWGEGRAAGLDLGAYRASLQARPIAGLQRNTSGLTYHPGRHTLFAVINRPPAVAEIATDGQLLRHIPLPGVGDAEGISHVQDDVFVVSDESDNSLHWFRIAPEAALAERVGQLQPALDFQHWHNLGLEGASWDEARGELLLVNEKLPQQVLIARGLGPAPMMPAGPAEVRRWQPRSWLGPLGRDLASLTVVPQTGNLLLLSEASALVTEYSRSGHVLGMLPLWRGLGGLRRSVPQPEGIALGPDGSIYVLSEPNLLYRFVRDVGP